MDAARASLPLFSMLSCHARVCLRRLQSQAHSRLQRFRTCIFRASAEWGLFPACVIGAARNTLSVPLAVGLCARAFVFFEQGQHRQFSVKNSLSDCVKRMFSLPYGKHLIKVSTALLLTTDEKRAMMVCHNPLIFLVGMRGFEPPASASRTLRSSQTEPHPAVCPDTRFQP